MQAGFVDLLNRVYKARLEQVRSIVTSLSSLRMTAKTSVDDGWCVTFQPLRVELWIAHREVIHQIVVMPASASIDT